MNAHTPGPWKVEKEGATIVVVGAGWVRKSPRLRVASVRDDCYASEEDKANAALIAAAPDLLKRAEDAIRALDHMTPTHGRVADPFWLPGGVGFELGVAIAKARGES